jgi:hypothetical protein
LCQDSQSLEKPLDKVLKLWYHFKSEEFMSQKQLVIKHDLSKLSQEELTQYLRNVSEFIGLDPNLNALDTIWMQNENGPGQSLVVYARRGTAEILRNLQGIKISSLTQTITPQGAIVFTATGENAKGRQEIAVGSKFVGALTGKALDDAIMTASTRALRRVTMQFTSLGILDESEVGAVQGSNVNPSAGATLAGSPVVFPPPSVSANNAPGRDVTPVATSDSNTTVAAREVQKPETTAEFSSRMQTLRDDAQAQLATGRSNVPVPSDNPTTLIPGETQAKPKRGRKPRNTVVIDGPEPEVVSQPAPPPQIAPAPAPAPVITLAASIPPPISVPVSASVSVAPPPATPAQTTDFPGKPTEAQMGEYRKRISIYTSELPSSENMGSVQKMRAFITRMSGTAPQFMTTEQWAEILSWFESFVERNQTKGLVKYINDSLGVK